MYNSLRIYISYARRFAYKIKMNNLIKKREDLILLFFF